MGAVFVSVAACFGAIAGLLFRRTWVFVLFIGTFHLGLAPVGVDALAGAFLFCVTWVFASDRVTT